MKIHLAVVRRALFGDGQLTTSRCGRLNAASLDGMNITADEGAVSCRFCLRRMETSRRLRAVKERREAGNKDTHCPAWAPREEADG